MKKDDSSTDEDSGAADKPADDQDKAAGTDSGTEVLVTDPDPVQLGKAHADSDDVDESRPEPEPEPEIESRSKSRPEPPPPKPPRPHRSWFGLFNFILILALAGAGGYYWWLQQQAARDIEKSFTALESDLSTRASNSSVDARIEPLKNEFGNIERKIDLLAGAQESLQASSEKLFELYGRDKNDWQFAEVEYLMRIAQHKLILQDDFEGAAITLQAASDKIAHTADPGLLPVRVMISEEIADLKTRKRPDLVGMTLILAQLARQVNSLQPGFAVRTGTTVSATTEAPASEDWLDRLSAFIDSLIEVRHETRAPTEIEANIADVGETLEDNLKLARWAVLDRDAYQYARLIEQSIRLFREFYDLDNAANSDFLDQMLQLQKMQLKPDKPDITGSLREMQRILSQRENAPANAVTPTAEPADG